MIGELYGRNAYAVPIDQLARAGSSDFSGLLPARTKTQLKLVL
jgi:hypothetical protein